MRMIVLLVGLLGTSSVSTTPESGPIPPADTEIATPLMLAASSCQKCNPNPITDRHSVCGFNLEYNVEFAHCSAASPWYCATHPTCFFEDEDSEQVATVNKLLDGENVSESEVNLLLVLSSQVVLNKERSALQILDCDGSGNIALHLPLDPMMVRSLAQ